MNLWLPSIHGPSKRDEFIGAWLWVIGERAALVRPDDRLMNCAQGHAEYLSQRTVEESMHVGRDNSTPNQRVQEAGYQIPSFWTLPNNCEACASNWQGPEQAVERLILSPSHRPLMLGERITNWFWEHHTVYGVGNSKDFYVFIAVPPEGSM